MCWRGRLIHMPLTFRLFLKNIYIDLFWIPVAAGLGRVTITGLVFFITGLFGVAEFWVGGDDSATAVFPMALGVVGLGILIVDWLIRHFVPEPATEQERRGYATLTHPKGWASATRANLALGRWARICSFAAAFAFWGFAGLMAYLLFGAVAYFFAVPQTCNCIVGRIPSTLSDALILKNSIRDASLINIEVRDGDVRTIRACYPQKPVSGNTVTQRIPGLSEKWCQYENRFSLHMLGSAKTYEEVLINISVQDDSLLPKIGIKVGSPRWLEAIKPFQREKTTGQFYMNRKGMSCTLQLADWVDQISGRLHCGNPKFHFNPWDWSQISELFYTRIFFMMHPQRR
jgi:hypothetical protein